VETPACTPTGSPKSRPNPTGSDSAGNPASDAGTVITSAAYPAVAAAAAAAPVVPSPGPL